MNTIKFNHVGDTQEIKLDNDEIYKYKEDIRSKLSYRIASVLTNDIEKKDSYEVGMFWRLLLDYEKLEPIEQKDFKKGFRDLLNDRDYHKNMKASREKFLKNYEDFIPSVFQYQNNDFSKNRIPRKGSLEKFYDEFFKN